MKLFVCLFVCLLITGVAFSVALCHRCPGGGESGDGALELGVPHAGVGQARIVHGGGGGDGQRGGETRVGHGGTAQELRR